MTEGRRCQVHLLDDRKLELLVQVSLPSGPSSLFTCHSSLLLYRALPCSSFQGARRDIWHAKGLDKAE